jgi:hypothetical protein
MASEKSAGRRKRRISSEEYHKPRGQVPEGRTKEGKCGKGRYGCCDCNIIDINQMELPTINNGVYERTATAVIAVNVQTERHKREAANHRSREEGRMRYCMDRLAAVNHRVEKGTLHRRF